MNTMKLLINKTFIATLAIAGTMLVSCHNATKKGVNPPSPSVPDDAALSIVTVQAADYDNGKALSYENNKLSNLQGCLFVDGKLAAVYDAKESANEGEYMFTLDKKEGTFYVLANSEQTEWQKSLTTNTTESEFLSLTQNLNDEKPIAFFSGSTELTNRDLINLQLKRGVARLDLRIRSVVDAAVEKLTIEGASLSTKPYPDSTSSLQTGTGTLTFTPTSPYISDTSGVAYLYEQSTVGMTLRADVVAAGKRYDIQAALPDSIQRNNIYVVTILQGEVEEDLQLTVEEWNQNMTDAVPNYEGQITVNSTASQLPANVQVSENQKEVTVPSYATEFTLALNCDDELEAQPITDYPVTIEPVAATKGLAGTNLFRIRKTTYAPGVPADDVPIRFRRKGLNQIYDEDQIVLHLTANAATIEGEISFDRDRYSYDFGRYVENELGRITLPIGKELVAEAVEGEDLWIKVVPDTVNTQVMRIIGGWRPNDPKADGRTQAARLVIRNTDGSEREEYTLTRQNWGLPVVEFGGNWWCKYNLRGNATTITDQISIQEDQARTTNLADYMRDCDSTELLRLLGDNYQGGNVNGLPLKHNGTQFYFEGMKASAQDFGVLLPTAMAPAGYQIPDKADYSAFGANTNFNLGGTGNTPKTFTNPLGEEVSVRVIERVVSFYGAQYGTNVSFYEFTSGGNVVVLCGLGHQWNTTAGNIAPKTLIMATYGSSGNTWTLVGYAQATKPNENWWKYTANNSTKTRVVRCIKTPVEYIY